MPKVPEYEVSIRSGQQRQLREYGGSDGELASTIRKGVLQSAEVAAEITKKYALNKDLSASEKAGQEAEAYGKQLDAIMNQAKLGNITTEEARKQQSSLYTEFNAKTSEHLSGAWSQDRAKQLYARRAGKAVVSASASFETGLVGIDVDRHAAALKQDSYNLKESIELGQSNENDYLRRKQDILTQQPLHGKFATEEYMLRLNKEAAEGAITNIAKNGPTEKNMRTANEIIKDAPAPLQEVYKGLLENAKDEFDEKRLEKVHKGFSAIKEQAVKGNVSSDAIIQSGKLIQQAKEISPHMDTAEVDKLLTSTIDGLAALGANVQLANRTVIATGSLQSSQTFGKGINDLATAESIYSSIRSVPAFSNVPDAELRQRVYDSIDMQKDTIKTFINNNPLDALESLSRGTKDKLASNDDFARRTAIDDISRYADSMGIPTDNLTFMTSEQMSVLGSNFEEWSKSDTTGRNSYSKIMEIYNNYGKYSDSSGELGLSGKVISDLTNRAGKGNGLSIPHAAIVTPMVSSETGMSIWRGLNNKELVSKQDPENIEKYRTEIRSGFSTHFGMEVQSNMGKGMFNAYEGLVFDFLTSGQDIGTAVDNAEEVLSRDLKVVKINDSKVVVGKNLLDTYKGTAEYAVADSLPTINKLIFKDAAVLNSLRPFNAAFKQKLDAIKMLRVTSDGKGSTKKNEAEAEKKFFAMFKDNMIVENDPFMPDHVTVKIRNPYIPSHTVPLTADDGKGYYQFSIPIGTLIQNHIRVERKYTSIREGF